MTFGDKTRRVWAILLFVILGPAVLLTVAGIVCHRRGSGGVRDEEKALFNLFRTPATLTDVEFVRPGTNSYFGLSLASLQTGVPFLFCPEILSRPVTENDSFFAEIGDFSSFGSEFSDQLLALTGETRSGPESDGDSGRVKRTEWLIPDLYVRLSEMESLHRWLSAENRGLSDRGGGEILFRIGRVRLMRNDADFDRVMADYRRPKRRFGNETIAALTEKESLVDHEQGTEETLRDQIAEYSAHSADFVLTEGRGTLFRSDRGGLFAFSFRPEGITAMEPALFVLAHLADGATEMADHGMKSKNSTDIPAESEPAPPLGGRLFWGIDCSDSPIPALLAAVTAPVFSDCGDGCWLTGIVTTVESRTAKGRSRRMTLRNLTVRNAALVPLLKKRTATRLEGTLLRLTIQNGEIQDGVFIGNGRFHLVRGRVSKDFLVRFQKEFALDFLPKNTLTNHFPDDMVPYDQIAFAFDLGLTGVRLHSSASDVSGVAGEFKSDAFRYQFFLPPENEKTVPYPRLLSTLSDGDENPFWTPFYRDALNHLSTGP